VNARRASTVLIGLAVAAVTAQILQASAAKLYPKYDEVKYLAIARDYAHEGGTLPVIKCYAEARCLDAIRPPFYQLFLAPVVDDQPHAFARAKLVEYAMALAFIATVGLIAARVFSRRVGVGSAIAVSLLSVMPEYGARLMHDLLFSTITVAAVYAFACWQDRGVRHWLAAGALIGLAFITKGSGHVLWAGLVAVAFYRHRRALVRRPILYAAAAGFLIVSSFYLMRNVKAFGSPFYSYIAPQLWLEKWRDFWALQLTPAYKAASFFTYMQTHTVGQLLFKIGRGIVLFIGLLFYTSGMLFQNQIARVFPGIGLLVLAGLGLRRRWREGRRVEVVAVGSTLAVYFAALSLAASGMNELQVRYVVPYIAVLIPYAVHELLERVWPWLRAWLATHWPQVAPVRVAVTALGIFLAARFALAAPAAFAKSPLELYAVEPHWHETSLWLSQHLGPGERFAMPYQSYYSNWDVPRPDPDTRWPFWYGGPADEMLKFMRQEHVRTALIDRESAGFAEDRQKLSAETDAHGPLKFLDWPRCFADSATPSRFLIYCQP
jgi:hypothetical protein